MENNKCVYEVSNVYTTDSSHVYYMYIFVHDVCMHVCASYIYVHDLYMRALQNEFKNN
jgi:hypothetical protein